MSQCHSSSTVQFAFDDKNHKPQGWLFFGNACRPHSDLKQHLAPNYTLALVVRLKNSTFVPDGNIVCASFERQQTSHGALVSFDCVVLRN